MKSPESFEYVGDCCVCGEGVDHNEMGICGKCGGVFHWGYCGCWGGVDHICEDCKNDLLCSPDEDDF